MTEAVKKLKDALSDQPANPLRNHQVQEYKQEAARLHATVTAPAYVQADRGAANERYGQVQRALNEQAAKPLRDKDTVARLADEVLEHVIRPALVPQEEMRRNPAGAVGKFLRNENNRETQDAIQQWKRAKLALEPDSDDPDVANVEVFRPQIHTPGQAATFMAGAQIPGQFAMSAKAKENWPDALPEQGTVNSPLAQAQARDKRERTPAQIAHTEKLKAAAQARKAAKESAG